MSTYSLLAKALLAVIAVFLGTTLAFYGLVYVNGYLWHATEALQCRTYNQGSYTCRTYHNQK